MKRSNKILFLACLVSLYAAGLFAQSCEEVTDRLLQKLSNTALQTDYNISITQPDFQSQNFSGQILMQGKCFKLSIGSMNVYYNGKTLWTHDSDIDEINISNPSDEELAESNPLLLIQLVRKNCRLHFTDTFKDKAQWSVDFYPNDKKSEVLKYTIQFRRADLIPTRIIISEIHSKKTTIILSGQKYGADSTGKFELDTKKFPEATINDMR